MQVIWELLGSLFWIPVFCWVVLFLLHRRFPNTCFKILSFVLALGIGIYLLRFALDLLRQALPTESFRFVFFHTFAEFLLIATSIYALVVFISKNHGKLPDWEIQKAIAILMVYIAACALYYDQLHTPLTESLLWFLIIPIEGFVQISYLFIEQDLFSPILFVNFVFVFFLPLCFFLLGKEQKHENGATPSAEASTKDIP